MSILSKILLTLAVLIFIGTFSAVIANYFNRHIHKIEKIAKDYVRRRLSERKKNNIDEFLKNLDIPIQLQPGIKAFLNSIAKIVGIDVEYLLAEDKFGDIFRVRKEDLGKDDQKIWGKAKLDKYLSKGYLNVFSYDILEALERNVGKDGIEKVNKKWEQMSDGKKPQNEEAWIEFIWQMSLREIILFFFMGQDRAE